MPSISASCRAQVSSYSLNAEAKTSRDRYKRSSSSQNTKWRSIGSGSCSRRRRSSRIAASASLGSRRSQDRSYESSSPSEQRLGEAGAHRTGERRGGRGHDRGQVEVDGVVRQPDAEHPRAVLSDAVADDHTHSASVLDTAHRSWLPIDGGPNLCDVGGLPCRGEGSTRHGTLLRSGSLRPLTPDDAATLMTVLGVATVIDLRTARELEADGPSVLAQRASRRCICRWRARIRSRCLGRSAEPIRWPLLSGPTGAT